MWDESVAEARRQIEICNACRYCEGYCSVFPAITRRRAFAEGDVTQLANLCHNCRGCYYACQYTEPHAFALNLPAALADVRVQSWERFAWPGAFARIFQRDGVAVTAVLVAGLALLFALVFGRETGDGAGFYAHMSHDVMVAIFAPVFLLPLAAVAVAVLRYWRSVGGAPVRPAHLMHALSQAGRMKDLSGGHGDGCNFEKDDRFSGARRGAHQAVLYGFLLCFASTSAGTVLHYVFDMPAPYGFFSLPKLLGVPGGVLMMAGCFALAAMKLRAARDLGAETAWGGEMAFVVLLFLVAATGLILYAATGTAAVSTLLAVHLGTVFALFVLIPYSKMVHGFFRLAALVRDAQTRNA